MTFTMEELYRKLFPEVMESRSQAAEELQKRETELLAVWHSLEFFEPKKGRAIVADKLGMFNRHYHGTPWLTADSTVGRLARTGHMQC